MRKNLYGRILKEKFKEQHLSIVPKSYSLSLSLYIYIYTYKELTERYYPKKNGHWTVQIEQKKNL